MDTSAIAGMAMSMKQTQLMNNVAASVMKKAMDVTADQAQGVIKMAENMPKFNGEVGSVLDVRA